MKKTFVLLIALVLIFHTIVFATKTSVTTSTYTAAFTSAANGDTLMLAAGTYTAVKFADGKRIILKSADKSSLAIVQCDITNAPTTAGTIVFDSIDIYRNGSYFMAPAAGGVIDSLVFRNCIIRGIARCFFRTTTVNTVNNMSFIGCIVQDCGYNGWNFLYFNAGYLGSLILKNNTFIRYKGESLLNATLASSPRSFKYVLDHNTFFKFGKDGASYSFCTVGSGVYTNTSTYNVTNNIFYLYSGTGGVTTTTRKGFIIPSGCGTIDVENNFIPDYVGFNIAPGAGWTYQNNYESLSSLGLVQIGFRDTAANDLTLPVVTPLKTTGKDGTCIGDPRWIATITNIAHIETRVFPLVAGIAAPASGDFELGKSVTVTATKNFGYIFKVWQDTLGNTVSANNPYTFATTAPKTVLVAKFEAIPTFAFNLVKKGLYPTVNVTPASTNGRYETGTVVSVTAVSNPISTFSYWENNSTDPIRSISMTRDTNLTATFDIVPFIVGWDFKSSTVVSTKVADYFIGSDNQGVFDLYNLNGSMATGSYKDGLYSTGLTGILMNTPAATFRKVRYFQTSFSTLGYQNIKVSSKLALTQQAFSTFKMSYSMNGTEFKPIDTLTFSSAEFNTVWKESAATLPAEAQNISRVYIRWMPDTTSTVYGTSTSADGSVISNIFVFADSLHVNDTDPPKLLSTIPTVGSSVAPINGSILLNFNEKMKAGSGNITLNGVVLKPNFGSKTVSFPYEKLAYNTDYTVILPAGSLTDLSGNKCESTTITFKTATRAYPQKKLFDAVVALDGSGDYTRVQAAIDAAPIGRTAPWLVYIKNGVYTEHHDIPSNKPYIHLIGQCRDSVIISDSRLCGGDGAYPVQTGATIVINADDCYFEDLTLENNWGYKNLAGPQALAIYGVGKRLTLNNCWLRSYQDTYLTGDRQYLRNCKVEGAVDFIYGAGNVFFDKCTITCNRPDGGYIVAPNHSTEAWGYVFSNCTIDASPRVPKVTTYYGRPWHNTPKTVFLNTKLKVNIYPQGWYPTMGGLPAIWADYGTVDSVGNPVDLSQRISKYYYLSGTDTIKGTAKNFLTDAEAATYTYENVLLRSGDSWEPRGMSEAPEKPANVKVTGNVITWDSVSYSRLYIVFRNGKAFDYTTTNQYLDTKTVPGQTYKYSIQAVSEYGALSQSTDATLGTNTNTENISIKNAFQNGITIYPNPFSKEDINIEVPEFKNGSKLTLLSIIGEVILIKNLEGKITQLNMSLLPSGNYLAKITTPDEIATKQLIKR